MQFTTKSTESPRCRFCLNNDESVEHFLVAKYQKKSEIVGEIETEKKIPFIASSGGYKVASDNYTTARTNRSKNIIAPFCGRREREFD